MTEPLTEPPVAPLDPRSSWDLPEFGAMASVTDLDETVTRVLAPNASPMTLDGTNTYVIGAPGTGEVIVVDPGPDDAEHLARVESVLSARDAGVRAVVVTHHHLDHAEAAVAWAGRFGAPVAASDAAVATPPGAPAGHRGETLVDGQHLSVAGMGIDVVATPGHTRDHLSLRLETGALLTGDHVLGRGTSVVAHPDGDLEAYLRSLHRVLEVGPDVLYPGHGPALREDPGAVLRFYAAHRRYREQQVLAALVGRHATPREVVADIYAEVDRRLWPAAEASTRATLALLAQRGQVRWDADGRVTLAGPA
jgi:glyoxylase-like metal-dependent hydrolase (beta-lactamase superfamily II)